MSAHKILIVKPSSLGDVVHSLPFLNTIRRRFPQSEIHWVIAKGFEGLLEDHPMIRKLWIVKKDSWKKIQNAWKTIQEVSLLFRELKHENYDMVIDLQGLLRSGIMTAATGSPVRIGFKEAREGSRVFYTHAVAGGKNIHAVDRYLKVAQYLGCDISDISFPFPPIKNSSYFILHPSSFTTHPSSFIFSNEYAVLVPGARWKTKRWPAEQFGRLASMLPVMSVIVGSKSDNDIAQEIIALSDGRAVSLVGKTGLNELIDILGRAQFVVSNDSGPIHIAAALAIPVFAIFGPTDPARTGPYGEGHTVIRPDVSCAPCFKKKCDDMKCMNSISADDVYKAIKSRIYS